MKQLDLFQVTTTEPDHLAADAGPMETLPDSERAAALRRRRYVTALEDLPPGRRGDAHLRAAIKALSLACADAKPPSAGSVRRWGSQLRRADGNLIGLAGRRVARLQPQAQDDRIHHLTCGYPLCEVVVTREVLRLGIPELGGPVHLLTGRDTFSGVIVAAALCTSERGGGDLLGLFGVRTAAAPQPLGAARMCMGIPNVLVLDRDGDFSGRAFRDSAAALGITLTFAPAGPSGGARLANGLQGWLAARGEPVESTEGLVAAVHDWLSHHDLRRSGPDRRTALDRWQEGLARYGINLAPTPTGGGTGRGDGRDGSGDAHTRRGR